MMRRGIVSAVYSLFDPLGFITPYIMKAKLLLQTLSRKRLGWVLGGVGTATRTLMGGVTCVLHIKLCPLSPYKLQFAVCGLKLTIHGL